MTSPYLSIVIPAYNEAARIVATLDAVYAHLSAKPFAWELIVVDDGSADDTAALVTTWARADGRVRVLAIPHAGKGGAVRHGMLAARGRYRFMCDADLAMPIAHLDDFLRCMEEGYDLVIGSREAEGARRFDEPFLRHLMGRVFNRAVRAIAVPRVQDTQCGFKCFAAAAAEDLFAVQRVQGFGFDVEILHLAFKRGYRVLELPIDWHHQRLSKVRPGVDTFQMLRDTLLVRWRSARGAYDTAPATRRKERKPPGAMR